MGTLRAQIYEEFRQFVWSCLQKASHLRPVLCSNGGDINYALCYDSYDAMSVCACVCENFLAVAVAAV